jgi:4-hydroxymandelate oxidase
MSTLDALASLADYETAALDRLPAMAREYLRGGAGDECTLRANVEAWNALLLRTRALVDVGTLDTATTLFGRRHAHPILLAPTAYQRLYTPDGELATARGASAADTTFVLSSFATTALEDVARAASVPFWFQLYITPDRAFAEALVRRAEDAGCEAICLTVDTPVLGARHRETRVGFQLPAGLTRVNLEGLAHAPGNAAHRPPEGAIYSEVLDPRLTWRDLEWLRGLVRVPLLLKGIMDPDDARRAVDAGVDGLIVSNHGARNLDTVPPTVTALPHVVDAVAGRLPVLVDGGIRRGTDVLKALALGADAVLIGRPYTYALAVEGAAGVARVVRLLRTELEMAMALTGRPTIEAIDRDVLWASLDARR